MNTTELERLRRAAARTLEALDRRALADIARVHHAHRELASVGVYLSSARAAVRNYASSARPRAVTTGATSNPVAHTPEVAP